MIPNFSPPNSTHGQALSHGTRLQEFVIEKTLGSGGFGITYLAQDTRLGRNVVVKENLPVQFCWREQSSLTVSPRDTEGDDVENFRYSLESFEREASTLALLDHPGIVKVLRSFEAFGTAYFVMPFVDGTAFDEVIRDRVRKPPGFTEKEIEGLLWNVLDSLTYLHEQGVYHRDIKPGNLLITSSGLPVLIDFGAARQQMSEHSLTVVESAGYTPFEQLQSYGKVGAWTDIYALGATLYKAITGAMPPKAADRIMDDPVTPLVQQPGMLDRFSKRLLESIDRAMAPNPADRFQACSEWRTFVWSSTPAIPPQPEEPGIDEPVTVVRRKPKTEYPTAAGRSSTTKADPPLPRVQRSQTESPRPPATAQHEPVLPAPEPLQKRPPHAAPALKRPSRSGELIVALTLGAAAIAAAAFFLLKPSKPPEGWDPTQATVKQLEAYAEDGDVNARVELAHRLLAEAKDKRHPDPAKTSRAFEHLKSAAINNHPRAVLPLGQCYMDGVGVEQDTAEGVKWLEKAATSGDARPLRLLAECYRSGRGVPRNSQKAMQFYRQAAEGTSMNLARKMHTLVLPSFTVSDATLEEAIEALILKSRELDKTELASDHKGVAIVIDEEIGRPTGKLTVHSNDYRMSDALRHIATLYNLTTEVTPYAVLLKPSFQ